MRAQTQSDPRESPRVPCDLPIAAIRGRIYTMGRLINRSPGGACFEARGPGLSVGDIVTLRGLRASVRWVEGNRAGLAYRS